MHYEHIGHLLVLPGYVEKVGKEIWMFCHRVFLFGLIWWNLNTFQYGRIYRMAILNLDMLVFR